MEDVVNHPKHYTSHGVECIEFTEHMNFCLGNAFKYVFRAKDKGKEEEDLRKALWYIKRQKEHTNNTTDFDFKPLVDRLEGFTENYLIILQLIIILFDGMYDEYLYDILESLILKEIYKIRQED
jgi:hypothetical protein